MNARERQARVGRGHVREPLFQREPDGRIRSGPQGKAPLCLPDRRERYDNGSELASLSNQDWLSIISALIIDSSQKETH